MKLVEVADVSRRVSRGGVFYLCMSDEQTVGVLVLTGDLILGQHVHQLLDEGDHFLVPRDVGHGETAGGAFPAVRHSLHRRERNIRAGPYQSEESKRLTKSPHTHKHTTIGDNRGYNRFNHSKQLHVQVGKKNEVGSENSPSLEKNQSIKRSGRMVSVF